MLFRFDSIRAGSKLFIRNFVSPKTSFYVYKPPDTMSDSEVKPSESQSTNRPGRFDNKRYASYAEMKEDRKNALKERRAKKKEHKEVGFSVDLLKQTEYYKENGLRKVYPYWFGWQTFVKERWFGRTLLDLFTTEFCRSTVQQSVQSLIDSGKIRVNGQIKPCDYKLKNGDKLTHTKHRHELPVLADKIKIIHNDENYLVIDKPCSIPIHPCGKYRYNSLAIILTKEFGFKNFRTMYRLDRLTSGLVILGKNFQSTLSVDKHIRERTAKKCYVARVLGEFPTGRIVVDKPIDCASFKAGIFWVNDTLGKEALTEFERLSFNGETSVVYCYPKTGRTHQIRLHLQYLGYPIVNDPLYNSVEVWGKTNGKGGLYEFSKEELEKNFLKIHSYESFIIKQEREEGLDTQNEDEEDQAESTNNDTEKPTETDQSQVNDSIEATKRKNLETNDTNETSSKKVKTMIEQPVEKRNVERLDIEYSDLPSFDQSKLIAEDECFECKQKFKEPERKDLLMYLHALSYKFGDLEFKTEMPYWAKDDFCE